MDSNNSVYDSRNNCNAILHTQSNTLISGCQNTTFIEGIVEIAERALSGEYVFAQTDLVLPLSLQIIGKDTFGRCNFTSIVLQTNLTSIGLGAFYFCLSLTNIYYTGTQQQFAEISKPARENTWKNDKCSLSYNYVIS